MTTRRADTCRGASALARPPPQPTGEAAGNGLPQVAPIELDAIEARARHRRLEGPAHAFDFWQFRHARHVIS